MRHPRGFDEVMIVNPGDPGDVPGQGATPMTYYGAVPPGYGYYGAPEPFAAMPNGYGWANVGDYAEEPYLAEDLPYGETEPYGYYAEMPGYEGWGESDVYGYGGYAGFGEYEPVGYFAEEYPVGYAATPYGYVAEAPELAEYEPVGWYGEMPEMVGYGEYEPMGEYEPVGEAYPQYGYYAEPEISGYVRDASPVFNAGCPLPSNVAGVAESAPLEGYVQPSTVNASCQRYTPQPGPDASVPDAFKPLW